MNAYKANSDYVGCPLCMGIGQEHCQELPAHGDAKCFDCYVCGRFRISETVLADKFARKALILSLKNRAILSHRFRVGTDSYNFTPTEAPLIDSFLIDELETTNKNLPPQSEQVRNLIRIIGDYSIETGDFIVPDDATRVRVGCINSSQFLGLLRRAESSGLIVRYGGSSKTNSRGNNIATESCDLTLEGWERHEAMSKGSIAGNFGFLAMKFKDSGLENFVYQTLKPCVKAGTGFFLYDLREFAAAGIIDNLLRQKIRESAFVLADLTHDNYGAYWEAGYAEGLGKPVIYICEKQKFEEKGTHFDTNHCTTVLWDSNDTGHFEMELVATIKRSLNLF